MFNTIMVETNNTTVIFIFIGLGIELVIVVIGFFNVQNYVIFSGLAKYGLIALILIVF